MPGGFGTRGVEGKILAAKYCRENKKPYLGVCLGMQVAVMTMTTAMTTTAMTTTTTMVTKIITATTATTTHDDDGGDGGGDDDDDDSNEKHKNDVGDRR